jgi:hypothetical protein
MTERPLLWLPASMAPHITADEPRDRPRLIVYETITQASPGIQDFAGTLLTKLASFDLETTLAIISNVNARLLHDGHADPALHQQLERDLVYPDLLQALAGVRASRVSDQSVIFTRRALLLLAKVVLGLQRDTPGRDFEPREIGTCVLIVNELLERTSGRSDDLLMIDMMVNWDVFTPVDVPHVMGRFRLIFDRLQHSTHPGVVVARRRLSLDRLLFDGLTYDEFQGLLSGVYTIITNAVRERKAPVLTIEPPLPAFVGDEKGVRSFFACRSHPLGAFEDWRYSSTWSVDHLRELLRDDFFLHDLTTFRRLPFIDLGGRYLLPDYQLSFDRMTFGSYWTVFDALESNDRLLFSGAWGIAFEEYIATLIDDVYPRSGLLANIFTPNFKLPGGEIDAVLDFGDHVIVLEVKSALLPVDVRSSRDLSKFDAWIAERLVGNEEHGGLQQLTRNVLAVRDGALGGSRDRVYPVLVTDEISFQALGVNRYLGRVFDRLTSDHQGIQPLTVITTEELEKLLPCVADGLVTWRTVLDRRASDRDGWLWVGQVLLNELGATGRTEKARRNDVLGREYKRFVASLSTTGDATSGTPS